MPRARPAKRHHSDGNRAVIYLRRSKDDADGSIPVQDASCRAYAAAQGWIVAAVEQDMESAYRDGSDQRAGYQRVLELARQGAVDHVIVWKWSRFGRDAGETLSRHRELRRLGVRLHSPTEDLDNPLLAGILAVIAENESRELSSRVAPAKRRLHAMGKHIGGQLPFGTARTAAFTLEPGRDFALVQEMFDRAAAGEGVTAIARALSERAGRKIHESLVSTVLRNPAYIGTLRATMPDGQVGEVAGAWPAMIDTATWAAAQATLARRRIARPTRRGAAAGYWFHGLLWCGVCGGRVGVFDNSRTRRGRWHVYHFLACYRHCRGVFDRPDPLAAWLRAELAGLSLPAAYADAIRAEVAAYNAARADAPTMRRRALEHERAELAARRERAEDGYLAGLYTADRALAIKGDADARIGRVEAELAVLAPAAEADPERIVALLTGGWQALADSDPDRYAAMATELIERVTLYPRPRRGAPTPRALTYRPVLAELRAVL